jgi:hypothetical protein
MLKEIGFSNEKKLGLVQNQMLVHSGGSDKILSS